LNPVLHGPELWEVSFRNRRNDRFVPEIAAGWPSGVAMSGRPAAKAKISTVDVFGFTAPGVSFQETVTPMHT